MIIITGKSGFVGQNLSAYLRGKQIEVESLSLRQELWKNKLKYSADALIHLAAKAHDTSDISSADEYFTVNRDLTIALFQEFIKSGINDFFFFSSVKAVADRIDGVLTEEVRPNAFTNYGKSKQEAEAYLISQKLPQGKRLFIIRPCMVHGQGNKGNLNLLFKMVEKGIPWPLAAFENERSFISIDNLSYLVYQMLQNKNLPSGIYNFADDKSISTNEIIEIISSTLGKHPKLWKIPPGLIKNIVRLGDLIPLPLNSERLKKLTESYIVSNQKIKHKLEINDLPLTAKEGLIKTIQSFKK